MILTVTLNPAIDKFLTINDFTLGRDHRATKVLLSAGGKGVNVSRALTVLNVPTRATGFLGGPAGRVMRERLKQEGITSRFIGIRGDTRSCLTVTDGRTRRVTRILESGPTVSGEDLRKFGVTFARLMAPCDYVVFSGRNVAGTGDHIYARLIAAAKRQHKKTVLDASGKALAYGLRARPYLIKLNLAETREILKKRIHAVRDLRAAVRSLRRLGIPRVIVSLGVKGAVGSDGNEVWWARPPGMTPVNAVGCGDALLAGFLCYDRQGRPFPEALRFGVAVGAASAVTPVPGDFSPRQAERIFKRIPLKRL